MVWIRGCDKFKPQLLFLSAPLSHMQLQKYKCTSTLSFAFKYSLNLKKEIESGDHALFAPRRDVMFKVGVDDGG